ncbi:CenpA [Carpediemonas membranifera]|uniref:CenpA n=1 Tax=Carpediemonas membranifera TaxID=201153 RepID=A0A8J6E214_9EUKA|nr:CenpA [Carpediemonas membranifera]|eukprot:KAG9394133.1 CenpA [Carpediemonas membranifera]
MDSRGISLSGKKPARNPNAGQKRVNKRHRRKHLKRAAPGQAAMREIRRLQANSDLLIPRLPFQRLVREIAASLGGANLRFSSTALEALQVASETFLTMLMECGNRAAVHGNRVTLMRKDFQLVFSVQFRPTDLDRDML